MDLLKDELIEAEQQIQTHNTRVQDLNLQIQDLKSENDTKEKQIYTKIEKTANLESQIKELN